MEWFLPQYGNGLGNVIVLEFFVAVELKAKLHRLVHLQDVCRKYSISLNILVHLNTKNIFQCCNTSKYWKEVILAWYQAVCRILRSWHKRSICDLSNFVIATTCSLIRKSRIPANKKGHKSSTIRKPSEKSQYFF